MAQSTQSKLWLVQEVSSAQALSAVWATLPRMVGSIEVKAAGPSNVFLTVLLSSPTERLN